MQSQVAGNDRLRPIRADEITTLDRVAAARLDHDAIFQLDYIANVDARPHLGPGVGEEVCVELIAHHRLHFAARHRNHVGAASEGVGDSLHLCFDDRLERKWERLFQYAGREAAAAGLITRQGFLLDHQHALPGLAEEVGGGSRR